MTKSTTTPAVATKRPHADNYASKGSSKRRYYQKNNPSRGAPGILLTCETGRETKCRREGMEILQYYWDHLVAPPETQRLESQASQDKLSLEEELATLKEDARKKPASPFSVFDTGCRGTVFFLCPSAESATTPATHSVEDAKEVDTTGESDTPATPQWNPLETVRAVITDLEKSNAVTRTNIPGSRFVTRMIPIQASCNASLESITETVKKLFASMLQSLPKPPQTDSKEDDRPPLTFSVHAKRRNCGHLKTDMIIDAVATVILETNTPWKWKVNLKQPDYTVWVEVCQTLCGISIVPRTVLSLARNFNLAEIREKSGVAAAE